MNVYKWIYAIRVSSPRLQVTKHFPPEKIFIRRSSGYLRRLTQQKSMHMDNVDLDIICDGLFILSSLCELDVHRKVSEYSEGLSSSEFADRKSSVRKVLK